MDTSQWMQEEVGSAAKSLLGGPNDATCTRSERKVVTRPQKEVNCPRCHSTNTKFCYYNNYSLTQPRYFCKTCRRYWTQGGTLRSVPVGGGSRKNNKKSTSTIHSLSMATDQSHKLPDLNPHPDHISLHDQGQGGNRGLRHHVGININPPHFPKFESRDHHVINTSTSSPASFSTLDFLKNGIAASGVNAQANTNNHNVHFAPSFPFNDQECHKPALAFTFDGVNVMSRRSLYGNSIDAISQHESLINGNTRVFPFGVTKQNSNTNEDDQQVKVTQENLNGYWIHNGMLGGGSW